MAVFALQFILTNVVFSFLLAASLTRIDPNKDHSRSEILLYGLGFGPMAASLLLYYLLLVSPRHSDLFYFLCVIVVFGILSFLTRKQWASYWNDLIGEWKKAIARAGSLAFAIFLGVILLGFGSVYLSRTIHVPLEENDALHYGNGGKILAQEKSIAVLWERPYPKTGYYQLSHHAPSFSLLLTWDKITGRLLGADQDLYYKSLSAYYAVLIAGLLVYWLAKKSKWLALAGIAALGSSFSFFVMLFQQHLDSFRIFFICVSWIFLIQAIEKRDRLSFLLLGISSGFAAFAHTIGAILAPLNVVALLLFLPLPWRTRWRKAAAVLSLMIVFGWFHYIIDIVWGFGWIIFPRVFTFWGSP